MSRSVIYPALYDNMGAPIRPFEGVYSNDDIATVAGSIISMYDGSATEAQLPAYVPAPPIQIVITDISGAGYVGGDFSQFYAKNGVELSITASVDKPDGTMLILPIRRMDIEEVVNCFGAVAGGSVIFTFAFSSAGDWECDEDLINTKAQGDDVFSFAGVIGIVGL